tara:strand:+ start:5970 stop:6620 length:651 start_codon:yes stop_codon:yes gene_type:complete
MTESNPQVTLQTGGSLREAYGETMEIAEKKCLPTLDKYCKEFIKKSPFLCIGTAGVSGKADVSPRGDPPGFVQIIDNNTLFIPDRPGNNRLDTMNNIIENPNVGILFIIPGYDDTLRVNGSAKVTQDKTMLASCSVNGKIPNAGILVEVKEAFLHCAKAFRRSKLWDESSKQDRAEMPTLGKMILEQTADTDSPPTGSDIKEADEFIDDNYKTGMY